MSDGKETKFIFLDDLHDTKVADFSKLNGIGKQWYEHCVGRSNFTVLGGTVMSVKEKNNVNNLVMDFTRLEKTSEKGREIAYTNNLTRLVSGDFGVDRNLPETLLAYWEAQAEAGYPYAEENVRYFEDMVRKENENAKNQG